MGNTVPERPIHPNSKEFKHRVRPSKPTSLPHVQAPPPPSKRHYEASRAIEDFADAIAGFGHTLSGRQYVKVPENAKSVAANYYNWFHDWDDFTRNIYACPNCNKHLGEMNHWDLKECNHCEFNVYKTGNTLNFWPPAKKESESDRENFLLKKQVELLQRANAKLREANDKFTKRLRDIETRETRSVMEANRQAEFRADLEERKRLLDMLIKIELEKANMTEPSLLKQFFNWLNR